MTTSILSTSIRRHLSSGTNHSRNNNDRSTFLRLLRAARGIYASEDGTNRAEEAEETATATDPKTFTKIRPTKCFPLDYEHVRRIPSTIHSPTSSSHRQPHASSLDNATVLDTSTPNAFHRHLCRSIRSAQRRVKIASLYIGPGTGWIDSSLLGVDGSTVVNDRIPTAEDVLLDSLRQCDAVEQVVLMDALRAKRRVGGEGGTDCATAVYDALVRSDPNPIGDHGSDFDPKVETENNETIRKKKGLYLFPVLGGVSSFIPSPLDEAFGVFHIKAYVVDDELILSGANLSEEYFTNRQDRYLSFVNGANGMVDFYSDLIDILAEYAHEYHPPNPDVDDTTASKTKTIQTPTNNPSSSSLNERRAKLADSLSRLFDGSCCSAFDLPCNNNNDDDTNDGVAGLSPTEAALYAVPTFQAPPNFFPPSSRPTFVYESVVVRDLLRVVHDHQPTPTPPHPSLLSSATTTITTNTSSLASFGLPSVGVCLSTAYLNPTPSFLTVLSQQYLPDPHKKKTKTTILTAAPISHGFAPRLSSSSAAKAGTTASKHGSSSAGRGRGWIPNAYLRVALETKPAFGEDKMLKKKEQGGEEGAGEGESEKCRLMLYDREGWTFHAKGLWLTTNSRTNTTTKNMDGKATEKGKSKITDVDDGERVLATVIGSSNFGTRSETLDFESGCVLLVNPSYVPSLSSPSGGGGGDGGDGDKDENVIDGKQRSLGSLLLDDWNEVLAYTREIDATKRVGKEGEEGGLWWENVVSVVASRIFKRFL